MRVPLPTTPSQYQPYIHCSSFLSLFTTCLLSPRVCVCSFECVRLCVVLCLVDLRQQCLDSSSICCVLGSLPRAPYTVPSSNTQTCFSLLTLPPPPPLPPRSPAAGKYARQSRLRVQSHRTPVPGLASLILPFSPCSPCYSFALSWRVLLVLSRLLPQSTSYRPTPLVCVVACPIFFFGVFLVVDTRAARGPSLLHVPWSLCRTCYASLLCPLSLSFLSRLHRALLLLLRAPPSSSLHVRRRRLGYRLTRHLHPGLLLYHHRCCVGRRQRLAEALP